MKTLRLFKKELGFTLIEIIIVLVIMSTAIAAVLFYQTKAKNAQKINGAIQAMTAMAAAVKANYGPGGTMQNLTVAQMISGGMIKEPFYATSATAVLDPFGGEVSDDNVGVVGFKGSFGIRLGRISKENCIGVAIGLANVATKISVGSVTGLDGGNFIGDIVGGKIYKASALSKPDATALLDTTDGCGMASTYDRAVAVIF